MTADDFNRMRIFPRIGMVFMSIMFIWFQAWFLGNDLSTLKEWHLVQYAVVCGMYVGLWKFYMETGPGSNKGSG